MHEVRKWMFATDLDSEEGMGDQSKFLEEICVFVFSYDINDLDSDIIWKNVIGRHCGMLNVSVR